MPGSKDWRIILTDNDAEAMRTTYALQVPRGVVLRHETFKLNPGGGVSESMVLIPNARLIQQQPDDWAIFGQPLSSPLPLSA